MFCIECGVRNPDGAKFCRECGVGIVRVETPTPLLPARASQSLNLERTKVSSAESEKVRHFLDMAFWHSEAGHLSAARSAAEAALKLDPFSSSALSLLGLIYEKQGDTNKAIEVFEKIVAINPGSIADKEKLANLRQGLRQPAVPQPVAQRLIPPLLIELTRRYPALPLISAIAATVVVLLLAVVGFGRTMQPSQETVLAQNQPVLSIPARQAPPQNQIAVQVPATPQQVAQPISPAVPTTSLSDPAALERAVADALEAERRKDGRDSSDRSQTANNSMPSVGQLQPLTVPSSDVPTHVVSVNPHVAPEFNHVVDVPVPSANSQDSGGGSSQSSDPDAPSAPASHIVITVHGTPISNNISSDATPVPSDSGRSITLRENPGAALQQKGLNLSQAGNYRAAEAAYESAIAAFQQDIASGRNVDEAKRGIDACQVAIEICKQSE